MTRKEAEDCMKRFSELNGPHWKVTLEQDEYDDEYWIKAKKGDWVLLSQECEVFDVYLTGYWRESVSVTDIPEAMDQILDDFQRTIRRMSNARAEALFNAQPWNPSRD